MATSLGILGYKAVTSPQIRVSPGLVAMPSNSNGSIDGLVTMEGMRGKISLSFIESHLESGSVANEWAPQMGLG